MTASPAGRAAAEDSELTQLGIERVRTEHFLWKGYRYTNLSDAIAAAKRGKQ
jgi:hypothetical protein